MGTRLTIGAFLLTLTMILSLACSGGGGNQTPQVDRDQQEIEEKIDALNRQIAELRQEVREANREELPTPDLMPTQRPTTDKEGTERTVPTPTKLPPGQNICSRSPEVQQSILRKLQTSSCRIATTEELFRITGEFQVPYKTNPRPGDFAGLVNVTTSSITVSGEEETRTDIPANTFHGMEKLTYLSLHASTETTLHEGSLQGLPRLKNLKISATGFATFKAGSLSGMPALETLEIEMRASGQIMPGALSDLPMLETLVIEWPSSGEEEKRRNRLGQLEPMPSLKNLAISGKVPPISPSDFQNLPKLETLQISGSKESPIELNKNSFSKNPEVKAIRMTGSGRRAEPGFREAFKTLHKLEELTLRLEVEGEYLEPDIVLSPNSPLMKDILNGDKRPDGYKVVPPGADPK